MQLPGASLRTVSRFWKEKPKGWTFSVLKALASSPEAAGLAVRRSSRLPAPSCGAPQQADGVGEGPLPSPLWGLPRSCQAATERGEFLESLLVDHWVNSRIHLMAAACKSPSPRSRERHLTASGTCRQGGGSLGPVLLGRKTSICEDPHPVQRAAEGKSFPPAQLPSGTWINPPRVLLCRQIRGTEPREKRPASPLLYQECQGQAEDCNEN